MDQDMVEAQLAQQDEQLVQLKERVNGLESMVSDLRQQVAYLEGRLGFGVDRQHLRQCKERDTYVWREKTKGVEAITLGRVSPTPFITLA
jgi:hypothetical protein